LRHKPKSLIDREYFFLGFEAHFEQ
jgi:hypothetical protein